MKAKLVAVFIGIVLAAGCGGNGTKPATTQTPPGQSSPAGTAAANQINISGFDFGKPLTVQPGQKIEIYNKDSVPHTVTSTGAFDVEVAGGKEGELTAPTKPGTYQLTCRFHPNMHGTLVVQ